MQFSNLNGLIKNRLGSLRKHADGVSVKDRFRDAAAVERSPMGAGG
jgi:hypothetical protein